MHAQPRGGNISICADGCGSMISGIYRSSGFCAWSDHWSVDDSLMIS